MKRKTNLLMAALILIVGALFMAGCEKNTLEPTNQQFEMVTQEFKLFSMYDINDKTWDFNTWNWVYNTRTDTLYLTNLQDPAQSKKIATSIEELESGLSVTIAKGIYDIQFITPHTPFWYDAQSTQEYQRNIDTPETYAQLANDIDILVNMENVSIIGTPIELVSSLADLLIVVDIPNIYEVNIAVSNEAYQIRLYKNIENNYHWGYFSMNEWERGLNNNHGLKLRFTVDGEVKYIEAKDWQLGKAYHVQTALGGTTTLEIPNFTTEVVIVP